MMFKLMATTESGNGDARVFIRSNSRKESILADRAGIRIVEDADDPEAAARSKLRSNLKQAMAAGDLSAVASLSEELDDVLFYVG